MRNLRRIRRLPSSGRPPSSFQPESIGTMRRSRLRDRGFRACQPHNIAAPGSQPGQYRFARAHGRLFRQRECDLLISTKIPPRSFFERGAKIGAKRVWRQARAHSDLYRFCRSEHRAQPLPRSGQNLHPNITIATANQPQQTEEQTSSDMIAMARYECLVRAHSGLSKQSSLMANPLWKSRPAPIRL